MLESPFKRQLIREILEQYPNAYIFKTNAGELQGVPDNLIINGDRWAMFEAKRSERAARRPNQEYYVDLFNQMSFAAFVYPQNKEWFLDELSQALRPSGRTRVLVAV